MDRTDCERLDAECKLAGCRARFSLPEGVLYFDGNSLGALPGTTASAIRRTIEDEWGEGLIRSWLDADWFFLARRAGDAIAPLIGASEGEVAVSDSTSVNLFKLAASLLRRGGAGRKVVTEAGNFPTDVYILEGLVDLLDRGHALVRADPARIADEVDEDTALVVLSHVDYRTGRVHDMEAITAHCNTLGVPVVWDLCHSAGAVPVALNRWNVDYAVGCTYKFLNAGPGAPAFTYVSRAAIGDYRPAVTGWFSHAEQFRFEDGYRAADSINKCLVGSPPVLSLRAVLDGVATFDGVGMEELAAKSRRLSGLFIELADERLAEHGFALASPRDPVRRGSQVSFRHPDAYAVARALIARGLIPDFREPDIVRFGIAPLYVRHVDIWDAVDAIEAVMSDGAWRDFRTDVREAVT